MGKIITFYSYKGGTGRSMALANVAWILASNGKKVLAIDWDLEAPGLHRYFYPFLLDKDLTSSDGLIDFVTDFAIEAATPGTGADLDPEWYKAHTNILRYASSLDWQFPEKGRLDFIPAGRQGASYAARVNSFNWQNFYDRLGGGVFLDAVKENLRSEYDYVLVDSRTGVSDTSGVCTVQLPDILVVCFTLNYQSIEGAAAVASSVWEQRRQPGLFIFPVAMRVENSEKEKLEQRKEYAKKALAPFPSHLPHSQIDQYWNDVEVMYWPYYAYEELLSAFGDKPGGTTSLLASCERLTSYLTEGEMCRLNAPPETVRQGVLARYARKPIVSRPTDERSKWVDRKIQIMDSERQTVVRSIVTRLVRLSGPTEVGEDTRLRAKISDFSEQAGPVLEELIQVGLLSRIKDPATGDETVELADDSFVQSWDRLRGWINEDRDFLLWRQQLQTAMANWETNGRDSGSLMSGASLAAAKPWAQNRGSDLNQFEQDYIKKSSIFAVRQKTRELGTVAAAALILFSLIVGYLKWQSHQRTEETALRTSTEHINAGNLKLKDKRYEDAIADFNEAIEAKPNNPDAYYNLGMAYFQKRDFESAISRQTQAIALKHDFAEAYGERGRSYRLENNIDGALADYNMAIEFKPNFAEVYNYRGFAYYKKGPAYYEKALEDCNNAIRISPGYAGAYDSRGNIYLARGDIDLAISDFDKAITLDPALGYAYAGRGFAYYKKGSNERALADLNRALVLRPESSEAFFYRGLVYAEKGQLDIAIDSFTKAVASQNDYYEALLYRGRAYSKKGSYDRAIEDFGQAITLKPESAEAYFDRGLAYKSRKMAQVASEDFQKALELTTNPVQRQMASQILLNLKAALEQPVSPRISVLYNDPADKGTVDDISGHIALTVDVQRVEQRSEKTRGDVRYYRAEDRQNADKIRNAFMQYLKENGFTLSLRLINLSDRYSNIDPGKIEVWLPPLSRASSESQKYKSNRLSLKKN